MPFSKDDTDRIRAALASAMASQSLTAWQRMFLGDMQVRFDKYGTRTQLSDKQYDKLKQILAPFERSQPSIRSHTSNPGPRRAPAKPQPIVRHRVGYRTPSPFRAIRRVRRTARQITWFFLAAFGSIAVLSGMNGSVHALERRLQEDGIVSKRHVSNSGRVTGAQPFSRGALFHLLRNRLYLGEIRHGETHHPGLHPAIIDRDLFDAVQHQLDGNARKRKTAREAVARSALTGRIFGADGHPMSPTFAYGKGGKLYRYYVSAPLQQGGRRDVQDSTPRRVSGPALEEALATALRRLSPVETENDADPLVRIRRVEVLRDGVELSLPVAILRRLEPRLASGEEAAVDPADPAQLRLKLPLRLSTHRGRTEVVAAAPRARQADPILVAALRSAHQMLRHDTHGRPTLSAAPDTSHRRRLVRLAFLAPDLQRAILAGEQPERLTLARFLESDLPLSWAAQRRMFMAIADESDSRRG